MLRKIALIPVKYSPLRTLSTSKVIFKSTAAEEVASVDNQYVKSTLDQKPIGWDEAKPYSEMPGPKPYPLVGNLGRLVFGELAGKDLIGVGEILTKKYGDTFVMKKFLRNEDMVFLYNVNDFEHLFRNEGSRPERDGVYIFQHYRHDVRREWFGENTGLVTEMGEKWYKFRKTVNPVLMQPRVTVQYIASMDTVAEEFIEIVRNLAKKNPKKEMPADFDNELNKWALESMGVIAIDKRLGCLQPKPDEEAQTLIRSVTEMFDLSYKLEMKLSFWRWFATPNYKRFVEVFDTSCGIIMKYVNEASAKIENAKEEKPVDQQSALEKLIKIDKQIAFTMVIDMLVAGIDTTSKSTAAVLYYLATNPRAQDALREEMMRLLPKKDSPVTKEVLAEAAYLKACIKEAQRFAPIASGTLRRTPKDLVFGGYQVPKGTQVITNNFYASMTDYPRANEFLPERWLRTTTGELSNKNVNPFTSLPFGFGPRSCVGQRLANLEMETLVAKMIRNFRLEWHYPDVTLKQSLLLGIGDPLRYTVYEIDN